MSHGPVHYDGDRLESLLFNPIDGPEVGNMLSSYLDPDSNFEFRLLWGNMSLKENLIIKVVLQIARIYSPLCTLILVVCFKVSINLN